MGGGELFWLYIHLKAVRPCMMRSLVWDTTMLKFVSSGLDTLLFNVHSWFLFNHMLACKMITTNHDIVHTTDRPLVY